MHLLSVLRFVLDNLDYSINRSNVLSSAYMFSKYKDESSLVDSELYYFCFGKDWCGVDGLVSLGHVLDIRPLTSCDSFI